MMDLHIDLGQTIITGSVGLVGWLIKYQISQFQDALHEHEKQIAELVKTVARLSGLYDGWNGNERRQNIINKR